MTRFCELRRKLVELFADAGIQSAAVDADLLISELAGVPRSELFFLADQPVPPALEKKIRELKGVHLKSFSSEDEDAEIDAVSMSDDVPMLDDPEL